MKDLLKPVKVRTYADWLDEENARLRRELAEWEAEKKRLKG